MENPPTGWFKHMEKKLDADDPDGLASWIWHNKLSNKKKKEIVDRYEKKSFLELSLVLRKIARKM
jgi:hypothetical protein